jgi:tyrosine-protein kinase Etk/Wzc
VQALALQGRFDSPTREAARFELSNRVIITADKKTGLIIIEAEDRDAAFAAKLANRYIDELKSLLGVVAVTEAQQRRVFFEQQVTKTQRALGSAEQAFRLAQARGGMVVSQALAEGGIKESAALRAQVAAREVQLAALSRFATAENPDVARLEAELRALRSQLTQLEVGRPRAQPTSGGQEAVQAYRDMKVQEAVLDALIRQFEMAKVDESREGSDLSAASCWCQAC